MKLDQLFGDQLGRTSAFLLVAAFCFGTQVLWAQNSQPATEASRAIIVLDASGSMWGQVEEKAKIDIAREVIGDLLQDPPQNLHLGLMAYGHRRKGDCEDIELLVPAGPNTSSKILAAVNEIVPKGKTPLTAAVLEAAGVLRFEEEAATVILVSDGLETCDKDPCEAARFLEKTGVSFKTHVVGFDLKKGEAQQLKCLADETGGSFF